LLQWNFYKKFEKRCSGDGAKWTFLFCPIIFGHFWTFLDIFPMKKLLQRIFIKSSKSDAVGMVQNGHFYFQVFFEIVAADFFQKFEKRCSGNGAKWTFLFSGLF
jgi:hypothetical protein